MSLILSCWSGCTVVSIMVEVLICAWCWSLICLLPETPISIVPSLITTVARSHNTRILYSPLLYRCSEDGGKMNYYDEDFF
jgi:hypothetical protein